MSFVFHRKPNPDQPHETISEYQGFIGDEAMKPRNKGRKKKFLWKLTGYSECTKTCGGGKYLKIRSSNRMVDIINANGEIYFDIFYEQMFAILASEIV